MANEPEKGPYYDVNDEYMLCREHAQQALATEDRAPRMSRLSQPEVQRLSAISGGQELCADCAGGVGTDEEADADE